MRGMYESTAPIDFFKYFVFYSEQNNQEKKIHTITLKTLKQSIL